MTHLEVLESGPASERTARSRWLLIALAVALVAAATAGWWWDSTQRRDENRALTTCVRTADRSARYAEARIDSMRTYIRPVLGSDASGSTRAGLLALVREQAQKTLPAVEAARGQCAATTIRPWHGPQADAKQAYLTYFDARLGVLHAIARDGGRTLTGDEGVPELRAAALRVLGAQGITP